MRITTWRPRIYVHSACVLYGFVRLSRTVNLYVCVLVEASKSCSDFWSAFFGACQLLARSVKSSFYFTAPSNGAYDEDNDGEICGSPTHMRSPRCLEYAVLLIKCNKAADKLHVHVHSCNFLDFVFMGKAYYKCIIP